MGYGQKDKEIKVRSVDEKRDRDRKKHARKHSKLKSKIILNNWAYICAADPLAQRAQNTPKSL